VTKSRLLVISDVHFFNPQYFRYVINNGATSDPPSRLSTDIALGDRKTNPFHALILLAREKEIAADALVCCGDITVCADPTAMNLGWLQLNRLAGELEAGEPIVTTGNHDLDSRFKVSMTSPQRALRFLDPPFPTRDESAAACYWANGYCILDRPPRLRIVLVNTCSLHGYTTEADRQLDHGFVPEQLFSQLPADLKARGPAQINVLVCHHHPLEIDLPAEDRSVISNGQELVSLLTTLTPPSWMIIHGHRHLPNIRYASAVAHSPTVFSAGSFAANLHLQLQGRAANQFYLIDLENFSNDLRGSYEAWTWDQHEGEWLKGQNTRALPASGGFGYRSSANSLAQTIAELVPTRTDGPITWRFAEDRLAELRFLLPQDRREILDLLTANHQIDWETDSGRTNEDPQFLRLGRRP